MTSGDRTEIKLAQRMFYGHKVSISPNLSFC